MFDIDTYIERTFTLDFKYERTGKGRWKWQDTILDGDVRIIFQQDSKAMPQYTIKPGQTRWEVRTVRAVFSSEDKKFWIVLVELLRCVG